MNEERQNIYIVEALAPQEKRGHSEFGHVSLPREWKKYPEYRKYLTSEDCIKKEIEFGHKPYGVVADTVDEAKQKVETTIKRVFKEFYEVYFKEEYHEELIPNWCKIWHVPGMRHIQLDQSNCPIYVAKGFQILGVAISYNEIMNGKKNILMQLKFSIMARFLHQKNRKK